MNKTLKVATTQKEVVEHVKDIYGKEVIVTIDKDTLEPSIKNKGKGAISKEIKEFILDFVAEELAPLKAIGTGLEVGNNEVEKGVEAGNNNNNDIATAIGQAVKDAIKVSKPEHKKWEDIPDSELNKGLMVEYGNDIVPVVSIYGEGAELAGVDLSMKDNTNYFWSYYGDIVFMKREHIHEMYNSSRKMKYYVKPLDDKIIKIYDLQAHYEDLEKISNINYIMSLSPNAVKELCKDLDGDRVCDIRDKVVVYLKQHRRTMPYDDVVDYCEALEIEEYMLD